MDELVSDFLVETKEGLVSLDSSLVELEKNPSDKEIIGKIFRVLHTIKGTCGFLGLSRLESVANAGEDVMDKVRSGTLYATPEIISIILEAADHIKSLLKYLENNGTEHEGDDSQLLAKIKLTSETKLHSLNEVVVQRSRQSARSKSTLTPSSPCTPTHSSNATWFETAQLPAQKEKISNQFASDSAQLQALFDSTPYIASPEKPDTEKNTPPAPTIRVGIGLLEELMQHTSELVLTRNQLMQLQRSNEGSVFSPALQRLNNITAGLQEAVMKARMQPIGNAWIKLPRIVRDLNIELGKKIELEMQGEETELDRQLLELIIDPLIHMVRNSADHGIETPDARKKSGKPEAGVISLKAYHSGGHIIIEISDDGNGINPEIIKKKIIEKNLVTENIAENMSKNQILQFIFAPGFSTAEKVTSVSGRGVGMDVVKNNIEKISGTIELDSQIGKGSKFTLRIPLTLAIMPVLKLEVGGYKFAIPQINVREVVQTGPKSQFHIESLQESHVLRLRGHLLPLVVLARALGLEAGDVKVTNHFVVICELGNYKFGVIVDQISDTEEIVVKPISQVLKSISIYSGNTIIGDGSVILILDPGSLAKEIGDIKNPVHNIHLEEEYSELQKANFLMFHAGDDTPKIVPLEMLSRLEEFNVNEIEYSHGFPVVQYRGELMRLASIDPTYKFPSSGRQEILVVSDDNKYMGLVAEKILDIVQAPVRKEIVKGEDGFLGSMVIEGHTCDVVDLSYYFHEVFKDDALRPQENIASKNMILLVDDSPFFRKFIPPELITSGFSVIAVGSASDAIKKLEQGLECAAIVTDINMPDIGGQEFVNICRQQDNLKNIPIIALSSERDGVAKFEEGGYEGIDAFVNKTNHGELVAVLVKLVKNKEYIQ